MPYRSSITGQMAVRFSLWIETRTISGGSGTFRMRLLWGIQGTSDEHTSLIRFSTPRRS